MPPTVVRIARDTETERVRELLAAAYGQYETAFPRENWLRYLDDILDVDSRRDVSTTLVAEIDDLVVGCVSYYPPGAQTSYPSESYSEHWPTEWSAIRLLAVGPSARGKGVGRTLTEACIDRSRSDGAVAIGLHTTQEMAVARAMYERMGFVRAPAYDFQPGPQICVEAYQLPL
ncbi:MAG: GNAT family N-acetyltransferase [Actinomycetota bacterium]|nr:GNAT family N-acetyltransferase [Actinomycetota bacterium]